MSKLTIVASITAKADQIDFVKAELEKLIAPTLSEAGCLNYDLHQNNENAAHFLFYENWETREHWLAHMETPHLAAFQAAAADALEEITVHELTIVG